MKTFKSNLSSILLLLVTASFIISCSKEDDTNKNVSENTKISTFLKSYYTKDYNLGKSLETTITKSQSPNAKTAEVDNLVITEVFVGDSNIPRGYVFTDKETNVFVYFVDVDRVDYKLTSFDIEANSTKEFENIDELAKYVTTNEFDIIKIALGSETDPNLTDKRRFWGSSYSEGPCDPNTGTAVLYEDYYVFGIRVHHVPSEDQVTGGLIHEPCGMH